MTPRPGPARSPGLAPSNARPLSRRRLWAFRLLAYVLPTTLGLALIVVTLIVQERLVVDHETGWIKLQSPPIYVQEPGSEHTGHRYLYDPLLGWRNIPNWKATTRGRPLTINSKGLRGPEQPYEKPTGTARILVLGDSFTWGYGVGDDEVFARVLEKQLPHDPVRWEVLNAGVSGYGTDQEYLYLINEGFKYAPDIVVLAFLVFNDPRDNSATVQYGLHKPAFRSPNLDLTGVPVPSPGSTVPQFTIPADPMDVTLAIILRMAEACAQHHCRLVVMKFGMFLGPEDPVERQWNARLAAALAQHADIAYLDLDQQFAARSLSKPELVGGNDHGHWNTYGHRVTATILHGFLVDAHLVKEGAGGRSQAETGSRAR
jgi:lysophospholipase L1-like esterase